MSQNQKLSVPQALDGTLIEAFDSARKRWSAQHATVSVAGGFSFQLGAPQWVNLQDDLRSKNGTAITGISVQLGSASINYARVPGGVFDDLNVSSGSNQVGLTPETAKDWLEKVDFFTKSLQTVEPVREIAGAALIAQRQLESQHNAVLQRLQATATGIIEQQAAHSASVERRASEKQAQLEADFVERRSALDALDAKRLVDLEERLAKLRAREAELDDREHTHARRALHGRLREQISQRQEDCGFRPSRTAIPDHRGQ